MVEPSRVSVFVIVTLTVATAQFAFSKEIAIEIRFLPCLTTIKNIKNYYYSYH